MNNISSVKTRILQYIEYKGITKYEFYKDSGITRSVLDKDSGISENNILKFIAYAPGISLEWLIKGEGEMFLDPDNDILNEPNRPYKRVVVRRVPLYDLDYTGGLAALFQEKQKPLSHVSVPGLPHCDGAVFVTGDTMYPFLQSGDIVLYKAMQNNPESFIWGEMYLISIDLEGEEYVSVRWLRKSDNGQDYVKLASENPHHEAKEIPVHRILALGLIKASIHFNTMR
ncbi:MAG: peptidase S24 [Sinomicrobium sp.]|nr:peptidase S24 [Sinomicrobium sp.]